MTTSVNIAIDIFVSFTPANGGVLTGLDSLLFGPARVDNAVIDTLRIQNSGAEDLFIDSGNIPPSAFTLVGVPFSGAPIHLPSSESLELAIEFSPKQLLPDTHDGTDEITENMLKLGEVSGFVGDSVVMDIEMESVVDAAGFQVRIWWEVRSARYITGEAVGRGGTMELFAEPQQENGVRLIVSDLSGQNQIPQGSGRIADHQQFEGQQHSRSRTGHEQSLRILDFQRPCRRGGKSRGVKTLAHHKKRGATRKWLPFFR